MPITIESQTSLLLASPPDINASIIVDEELLEEEHSLEVSGDLEQEGIALIYDDSIESFSSSTLHSSPDKELGITLSSPFSDKFYSFFLSNKERDFFTSLKLTPGNVPAFQSDINRIVTLRTVRTFNTPLGESALVLSEKGSDSFQALNLETNEEVSASGDLTLVDVIGPVVRNEIPISGSRLVDPASEISFDLVDDAIGIRQPSIQVYVSGNQLVENGVATSISGYGQSFLTKVSDNLFQFLFVKDEPFSLYETVSVSGYAEDLETPANSGTFSYDFTVWDLSDLSAQIDGGPDVEAPYLTNLSPFPGQTQVDPNFNITLEIADDHAGVNPSSVSISVDGNAVVQSGVTTSTHANTVITALPSIRGYKYQIDLNETLPFFHQTSIEVYAEDLFVISGFPNTLDTSYFFTTTSNQHLVISGFSILQEDYETLLTEESFDSGDPTQFRIIYRDLTLSGIDVENSFVFHNGEQVSGVTFTEVVSGSQDAYFVDFGIEPYYFGESILRFRATQVFSGAVVGSIAPYRDTFATLQWGYEMCYDPSEDFEKDSTIEFCVKVYDHGHYPSLGSFCSNFYTEPHFSRSLSALIYGVELGPSDPLPALYTSNNTFFEFGKTMEIEIEAKDFSGNTMIFPWTFTIEQ